MAQEFGTHLGALAKRPSRWRRRGGFVAATAIGAAVAAIVTLGTNQFLPDAADQISGIFTRQSAQPTKGAQATQELFRRVERADLWVDEPWMFKQSRKFLATNFRELNPWQAHHQLEPVFPILSAFQLAKEGSLYAGRKITLVGKLHYLTVAGTTGIRTQFGKTLTYLAQVGAGGRDDPLVYCLFSDGAKVRLRPGMQVVAVGVPIAEGSIRLRRGGFAEGAYMAGAMVGPYRHPEEVVQAAIPEARS